jgi:glycosyltransferase 2 family protein
LRTAFRTILVAGLAVALLAFFLRNADLAQVGAAVQSARTDLLGLTVALTVVVFVIRTIRWQYLLQPLGPTRFWVAFRATILGFAASTVLPARAGEVLRPYLLARREGLDVAAAFATIVVERLLDLATVLLMLAIYLVAFDPGVGSEAPTLYRAVLLGAWIATPLSLALLATMMVLAGRPERGERMVSFVTRVLPASLGVRVAKLGRAFAEGLVVVRRPERLLAAFGWSLVLWVVIATQGWLVARAFDIAMPFAGAFLITALLVVGIAVPTPGGVGGFHEAFRLGATAFFGAANDSAVAAAIVLHAASMVPVLIMGAGAAVVEGLSFGRLKQLQQQSSGPAHDGGPMAIPRSERTSG